MWQDFPLFPESASTFTGQVDALYFFALGVTAFFSLLIGGLIFYFAVKYRRRSDDEVGTPERASTPLEITWSVIPLAITMVMFVWGARVFFTLSRPPADATEYFVVGKQWMWKLQHPEGNREINELHVPLGQPIQLTMTSEDVIHSFYVPAFRIKADVLPGRYTTVWFEATKAGSYQLFCAEYCGAEHSRMIGRVVVMEPRDYEIWLSGREPGKPLVASGEELFQLSACHTCHREDTRARGPSLVGLFGKEVELATGRRVIADETYLRESILRPAAKIVAGYQALMPTYQGRLSEEQLVQLISYIKTLGPPTNGSSTP